MMIKILDHWKYEYWSLLLVILLFLTRSHGNLVVENAQVLRADSVRPHLLLPPQLPDYPLIRAKRETSFSYSNVLDFFNNCSSDPSCSELSNVTSHSVKSENSIFVSTLRRIIKTEISNSSKSCVCTVLYNTTNEVLSIVTDNSYIYWLSPSRSVVKFLDLSSSTYAVDDITLSPEIVNQDKHGVRAACRIPSYVPIVPYPTTVSGSFLSFNLTGINATQYDWFTSPICIQEANPDITFAFLYVKRTNSISLDGIPQICFGSSECIYEPVSSDEDLDAVQLNNLSPDSEYVIHLMVYSETLNHKSTVISPGRVLRTSCGVSSPVTNLTCSGIDSNKLQVLWNEPIQKNSAEIRYEVYINDTIQLNAFYVGEDGSGNLIHNTRQNDVSYFTVRTFPLNCSFSSGQYSSSVSIPCRSFLPPVQPFVVSVSSMRVTLNWTAPADNSVQYLIIEWSLAILNGQNTRSWSKSEMLDGSRSITYAVTDLVPYTGYTFRVHQQYAGFTGNEGWHYSASVSTMTSPDIPSFPLDVAVEREADIFYLTWTPPKSNGADLLEYVIEYRNRSSPNASRILYNAWKIAANRSASFTRYRLTNLIEDIWYEFRVSALNAVGLGDKSEPSSPFCYSIEQIEEGNNLWLIIGTVGGLVALIFIIILVVACRRCGKESTKSHGQSQSEITTIHLSYGADLQLAQIRHMAELASWRGVPNLPQDYMDLLPVFPREKLTLTDFLGKGAFGEVYKGVALLEEGEKGVAVKTLREGSTDSEKCEFLMEAYFMSNFDHENILSLLGVCLDNEPQYLILELMDGGDLLHYMRDARPNPIMSAKLTTEDLLAICLDVAAGCKYLNEQHFIHRDLAARNCLVSTKSYQTTSRIVKIGDFGLARDIYRNDYYHKAGEGLLPVRWMAPESLVDNIYTAHSDIWSFGVLLWEIMTFGQQPYPARTNIEVLQMVRAGGRLGKPDNCPDGIYTLLLKCWHNTPTLRPSFGWALQWLQEFKRRNAYLLQEAEYQLQANINYTTVTTSEEDCIEEDELPRSPRSPENRFTAAVLGFDNVAFVENDVTVPKAPLNSDDESESRLHAFINRTLPTSSHVSEENAESGGGYLRVSNNPPDSWVMSRPTSFPAFTSPEETSQGQRKHEKKYIGQSLMPEDEDALNYSMLSFPPSRNASTKSNHTFVKELSSLPAVTEVVSNASAPADQLLPYMGDLPITDEERLMRKQYWKRQELLKPPESLQGESSNSSSPSLLHESEATGSVSPYIQGVIPISVRLQNYNGNNSSHSEDTDQDFAPNYAFLNPTFHIENPNQSHELPLVPQSFFQNSENDPENEKKFESCEMDVINPQDQEEMNTQSQENSYEFCRDSITGSDLIEELTRHWTSDPDLNFSSSPAFSSLAVENEIASGDNDEAADCDGLDTQNVPLKMSTFV